MYEPSSGSIFVDDTPLARVPAAEWRARLAGAFQDFFRFEFRAGHTVGLGDVPRMDDEPAVVAAVDRAGAGDVVARLTSGLDTQLGRRGRPESSSRSANGRSSRWRVASCAIIRFCCLDEPTAALDAETEHALFERYAAAARATGENHRGRITIIVSHRFSTVRMADLIVVLDGARLVEVGTHDELMAREVNTRSCTASRPPPTADHLVVGQGSSEVHRVETHAGFPLERMFTSSF